MTPAALAQYFVDVIEAEAIPEAWAELDVDPLVDPLVAFFVSIKYFSPLRPFHASSSPSSVTHPEWNEASDRVLRWLREGLAPAAVDRKLRRMQKWPWGAVVVGLPALGEELKPRYELSEAQPETELGRERIPGGIVITCEILMRGLY